MYVVIRKGITVTKSRLLLITKKGSYGNSVEYVPGPRSLEPISPKHDVLIAWEWCVLYMAVLNMQVVTIQTCLNYLVQWISSVKDDEESNWSPIGHFRQVGCAQIYTYWRRTRSSIGRGSLISPHTKSTGIFSYSVKAFHSSRKLISDIYSTLWVKRVIL